jgi:hypothetical protein
VWLEEAETTATFPDCAPSQARKRANNSKTGSARQKKGRRELHEPAAKKGNISLAGHDRQGGTT